MEFELYHIMLYPIESWQPGRELDVIGRKLLTRSNVILAPGFGIAFQDFTQTLVEEFNATYEYDSSFGIFLNGESVSGQLGANDLDQLCFIELHQCKKAENLDCILKSVKTKREIGVQILELGAFVDVLSYNQLLDEQRE